MIKVYRVLIAVLFLFLSACLCKEHSISPVIIEPVADAEIIIPKVLKSRPAVQLKIEYEFTPTNSFDEGNLLYSWNGKVLEFNDVKKKKAFPGQKIILDLDDDFGLSYIADLLAYLRLSGFGKIIYKKPRKEFLVFAFFNGQTRNDDPVIYYCGKKLSWKNFNDLIREKSKAGKKGYHEIGVEENGSTVTKKEYCSEIICLLRGDKNLHFKHFYKMFQIARGKDKEFSGVLANAFPIIDVEFEILLSKKIKKLYEIK